MVRMILFKASRKYGEFFCPQAIPSIAATCLLFQANYASASYRIERGPGLRPIGDEKAVTAGVY